MNETRTINGQNFTWVACSRCSGTGQHGPLSIAGGRCFGCTDADGKPAGGHWVAEAMAKRRVSAAKRREAARKSAAAAKAAEFAARNDAAIVALEAVGFENVRELKGSAVPTDAYPAWDAIISVRDHGADPAEAYRAWLDR